MTKIAELRDKGAVVAWSPLGEYADVIACGSKVRLSLFSSFTEDNIVVRVCGGEGEVPTPLITTERLVGYHILIRWVLCWDQCPVVVGAEDDER